jgi:hypothetical protein
VTFAGASSPAVRQAGFARRAPVRDVTMRVPGQPMLTLVDEDEPADRRDRRALRPAWKAAIFKQTLADPGNSAQA